MQLPAGQIEMSKQRLEELDLAKGLAIFLVVVGHIVTGRPPTGNEWYGTLQMLIYEFHMPFFMFLSGVVFQLTFRPLGDITSCWTFISSRAKRLLPAFVLFSIIIWAAKHAATEFLNVDNFDAQGWRELFEIYISPTTSVARSLWYIYVLLELYVLFAIAETVSGGRLFPVILLAVAMRVAYHFASVTETLGVNALCEYAVFFAVGTAFAQSHDRLMPFVRQNSLTFYSIFLASFLTMLFLPHPWSKGLVGLASLPAGLAFASSFTSHRDKRALLLLGEYTFTIYLMNTIFIGLFKGVLLKFFPWDGAYFVLHFLVLLTAGVLGPIAVFRLLFPFAPSLARIAK